MLGRDDDTSAHQRRVAERAHANRVAAGTQPLDAEAARAVRSRPGGESGVAVTPSSYGATDDRLTAARCRQPASNLAAPCRLLRRYPRRYGEQERCGEDAGSAEQNHCRAMA